MSGLWEEDEAEFLLMKSPVCQVCGRRTRLSLSTYVCMWVRWKGDKSGDSDAC